MDIRKIDYEQLLSMTNEQLEEAVQSGIRDVKRGMLGYITQSGQKRRGLIEQIANKLYKNPMYPIPQSLRGVYDYSDVIPKAEYIPLTGLSGQERRNAEYHNEHLNDINAEIRRKNRELVQEWVRYQKDRFQRMTTTVEGQSALRHQLVELRNFLNNKTISGRAWNDTIRSTLRKIEEGISDITGQVIHIPTSLYAKFMQVYNYLDNNYGRTNYGERYEVYRQVARVVIQDKYRDMSPKNLATMLNNTLRDLTEQGAFEVPEEDRVNEFDASGILFRR